MLWYIHSNSRDPEGFLEYLKTVRIRFRIITAIGFGGEAVQKTSLEQMYI
jgi:hypothetical protein